MRLTEGSIAPGFEVKDYRGKSLALAQYQGQKVMLSFFRGASCPFCNLRVHELIKNHELLKNYGLQVVTFFAASPEEIQRYAGTQDPSFPIIPDPELDLYRQYGLESSHLGIIRAMLKPLSMIKVMFSGFFNLRSIKDPPLIPADFLIDKDQTISKVYYGKDFGDHLPLQEILQWSGT